jgi:hypothetical protein
MQTHHALEYERLPGYIRRYFNNRRIFAGHSVWFTKRRAVSDLALARLVGRWCRRNRKAAPYAADDLSTLLAITPRHFHRRLMRLVHAGLIAPSLLGRRRHIPNQNGGHS